MKITCKNIVELRSVSTITGQVIHLQMQEPAHYTQETLYNVLYKECNGIIKKFVYRHFGTEDDFNDLMQETFLAVSTKLKKSDLHGVLSLKAYLIGVSRNLWFKELERKRLSERFLPEIEVSCNDDDDDYTDSLQQRYNLYWKYFIRLGHECRKIINSAFKKEASADTSYKLGYTRDNFYKRKSLCLKSLYNKIKQDPLFNNLKFD